VSQAQCEKTKSPLDFIAFGAGFSGDFNTIEEARTIVHSNAKAGNATGRVYIAYEFLDDAIFNLGNLQKENKRLSQRNEQLEKLAYERRAIWTDHCGPEEKQLAQIEADEHGCPVEINVHGTCYFIAKPSRIKELEAENSRLAEGLRRVVEETDSACVCNHYAKACRSAAIQALHA
jgi:cell division septum initiation protein DivIVA